MRHSFLAVSHRAVYTEVTSSAALAWQRVRLGCQMAHTGPEWGAIVATHNSGTYNNQYMVVDFKLFSAGAELVEGTLYDACTGAGDCM